MTHSTTTNQPYRENQSQTEDEIDLSEIISLFARRWRWIASSSTIGLILSSFYLIIANLYIKVSFRSSLRRIVINQVWVLCLCYPEQILL